MQMECCEWLTMVKPLPAAVAVVVTHVITIKTHISSPKLEPKKHAKLAHPSEQTNYRQDKTRTKSDKL